MLEILTQKQSKGRSSIYQGKARRQMQKIILFVMSKIGLRFSNATYQVKIQIPMIG